MDADLRFNLFIAYYGSREQGSEAAAESLYDRLNGSVLFRDFAIAAYFHPRTNPHGSFEETPMIVARTPLFLLVVDSGVPVNFAGQLEQQRKDGTYRNLFEEVQAFHNSPMYKQRGASQPGKLFIADDMSFKRAEALHTVFAGHTAMRDVEEVRRWMRDFYTEDWPSRLARNGSVLYREDPGEFLEGHWGAEAYESWHYSRHTELGKRLLVYCVQRVLKFGDADCVAAGREIFTALAQSGSIRPGEPLYTEVKKILRL